jgi:flagellar biosynthetic protein FlhB
MAEGENRTYPATARRLQKARDEGDVPLSREAVGLLSFGLASLTAGLIGPSLLRGGLTALRVLISDGYNKQLTAGAGLKVAMLAAMEMGLPIVAASALGGMIGVLIQTRFMVRFASLRFDISRLSPSRGFKRLFGPDGLIELLKATVKLILMGGIAWFLLAGRIGEFALLPWRGDAGFSKYVATFSLKLLVGAAIVQALVAILDIAIVRFRFQSRHRMSREDIKEEFKETEGNPHTKSRIRRLQRAKRRNMTKAVQTATVVVTNPTHYAVALSYDKTISAAPRITAKGADLVALRIRELAKASSVSVVESPVLARALFRLDLDVEIPPEHYKAVAEIVAFVWRLKGRFAQRR